MELPLWQAHLPSPFTGSQPSLSMIGPYSAIQNALNLWWQSAYWSMVPIPAMLPIRSFHTVKFVSFLNASMTLRTSGPGTRPARHWKIKQQNDRCVGNEFPSFNVDWESSDFTYQGKEITFKSQTVPRWKTVIPDGWKKMLQHGERILHSIKSNLTRIQLSHRRERPS